MGTLSCLNVSGGDIEITFDTKDCAEAIRAKRIITDMLRRGYALLVKTPEGDYTRALQFDEKVGEYIIADYDSQAEETSNEQTQTETKTQEPALKGKGNGRRKRVSIEKAETVAVAPSAGG